jgi:activin receptor type-2B
MALPSRIRASDLCLTEKISQGQFSSVWKARLQSTLNQEHQEAEEFAIKIFACHQKTAWSNEKQIYNSMSASNENILKYFASDIKPDVESLMQYSYWLITEYHSNGSLYDFLTNNYLSWPQMVSIILSFLEGLAYLHSEDFPKEHAIAHRDIKSKNILIKHGANSCCIADFGLALKIESKHKLNNNNAEIRSKVGTKRYMSPELIEGAIAFNKETFLRIDVYASALVLWEIVSRGDFFGNYACLSVLKRWTEIMMINNFKML